MKCILTICAIFALIPISQAERSSSGKKFSECYFIDKNSIRLILGEFDEHHTQNNCPKVFDDEEKAKNVKSIKLSGSKFDEFGSSFEKFAETNEMQEFQNMFQGIQSLDLSNNSIISTDFPILNFRMLEFLNISRNRLREITHDFFEGMPNLREIDLSFNKLRYFFCWREDPFANLAELKVIDFRNNKIFNIDSAFDGNKKLKTIKLQNNPMKNIFCDAFELLKRSVSVEISWDYVVQMNMECMENKLKIRVENGEIMIRSMAR